MWWHGRVFDPVAVDRLALTLLHFLWQGVGFVVIAALLLAFFRRGSPIIRYRIGCLTLLAMVAAPPLTFWWLGTAFSERGPLHLPEPWDDLAAVLPDRAEQLSAAPHEMLQSLLEEWIPVVLPLIVAFWAICVCRLIVRTFWSWLTLRRLLARFTKPLPAKWSRLRDLVPRLHIDRAVDFRETEIVEIPVTAGWRHPVVVIPRVILTRLPVDQVEALVSHELAHVRRWDAAVTTFTTYLRALLFFHPAVWWLCCKISDERENCCDDMAAAACGDGHAYAAALAALEELRSEVPVGVLSARGGPLVTRIARILGKPVERSSRGSIARMSGSLAAAAVVLSIGGYLFAHSIVPRRAHGLEQVESLGTAIYDVFHFRHGEGEILPRLERAIQSLRQNGTCDNAILCALIEALNTDGDATRITQQVLPRINAKDPESYQNAASWKYGRQSERTLLVWQLWQEAKERRGRREAEARVAARAALCLAAQDSPLFGTPTVARLLTDRECAPLTHLSSQDISRLRRHLHDHIVLTRASWVQFARATHALSERGLAPDAAISRLLGPVQALMQMGETRWDIEWRATNVVSRAKEQYGLTAVQPLMNLGTKRASPYFWLWLKDSTDREGVSGERRAVKLLPEVEIQRRRQPPTTSAVH